MWRQHQINGGFTYLTINPAEPDILYTISMGTVHRSDDGGVHWQAFSFNYLEAYFEKLFFDLADLNHWIILTQSSVIESFDGGKTFSWQNAGIDLNDSNFPSFMLSSIAQNPFETNIFMICGPGIYRSTDRGIHWEKIRSGYYYDYILYDVSIKDEVYTTYYKGGPGAKKYFLKSTNNGTSWDSTLVNASNYFPLYQTPDGTIYLGNIFSTDRGNTWMSIKPANPLTRDEAKGDNIIQYAYDQKRQYLYAVDQGKGLLKLKLGGDTWELTPFSAYYALITSHTRKPAKSVAIDTLNDRIYVVCGDSLFVSERGGEFIPVSTQLFYPTVNQISFKGSDTLLAAVPRFGRSAISLDKGKRWEDIKWYSDLRSAAYLPFDNFLLAERWYNTFYYSFDYGNTFIYGAFPGPDHNERMKINPLDPSKIFGGGGPYSFFYTTRKEMLDTASSRHFIPIIIDSSGGIVSDFDFHPTDASTYYVLLYGGYSSSNLYKCTDGGVNWIALTNNTGLDSVYRAISVDPEDPKRIYIATDWGIIYTHDEGVTWNKGKGPLPNGSFGQSEFFSGIVVDRRASNIIYSSSRSIPRQHPPESNASGGVYRSTNYGETWQPMNMEGLLNVSVNWLQYKDNPPRLIACTMGGAYEYLLPDPVSVREEKKLPDNFQLSSIYPNPVNNDQRTMINYQLPKREYVCMRIYDLFGRNVSSLVHDYVEAGEHQIHLQPHALDEGIYFVQMNAGGTNHIKKFIVMK